jgi:hypothetical protein
MPQVLLLLTILLSAESSWADREVVLVTSTDSAVQSLSTLDIRKAYLGIAVLVGGEPVRAIRRRDDTQLNEIFLQSVMAMSQKSYERRILSLALKYGTPRPDQVDDAAALVGLLESSNRGIGYMWRTDAEGDDSVRIIGVLWRGR